MVEEVKCGSLRLFGQVIGKNKFVKCVMEGLREGVTEEHLLRSGSVG